MRALWALILLWGVLFLPGGEAACPQESSCLEVSSAEELRALSRRVAQGDTLFGCTVCLTQDIAQAGYLQPIGNALHPFEGTFEGQGHVISGLTVDGYLSCTGLFGCIGRAGCVRDLTLEDSLITGRRYTGALAGLCAGRMEQCAVKDVRIRCLAGEEAAPGTALTGTLAGGLTGSIRACAAWECRVEGAGVLGGLIGRAYGGSMRRCLYEGRAVSASAKSLSLSARNVRRNCAAPGLGTSVGGGPGEG